MVRGIIVRSVHCAESVVQGLRLRAGPSTMPSVSLDCIAFPSSSSLITLGLYQSINLCARWSFPRHVFPIDKCTSGFAEEGRDREANFQDGRWWDLVHMGILEKEWTAKSLVSG
jgi:hypothetical protein